MFAKFDENPAMILQEIKNQNVTDNVKTVYNHKVCGGVGGGGNYFIFKGYLKTGPECGCTQVTTLLLQSIKVILPIRLTADFGMLTVFIVVNKRFPSTYLMQQRIPQIPVSHLQLL